MPTHRPIDIARWLDEFPYTRENVHKLSSMYVTSPLDVAVFEHLRRQLAQACPLGEQIPVDLFVLNFGEPTNRAATKIGGLPCRSKELPWPSSEKWGPMRFLMQFNFTDSRDIVGQVLNDILQVFIVGPPFLAPFRLHLEWVPTMSEGLVSAANVFPSDWDIPVCYGDRFRTSDLTDEERLLPELRMVIERSFGETWGEEGEAILQNVLRPQGVKVGGVSYYEGRYPVEPRSAEVRLVGSFQGVAIEEDTPYPWINHPEPLDWRAALNAHFSLSVERPMEFYLRGSNSSEWFLPYF